MFYTETKGHRWAMMAVDHKTIKGAVRDAIRTSRECSRVYIWDCRGGYHQNGKLLATYVDGKRKRLVEGGK